jgi:hypothetical protein
MERILTVAAFLEVLKAAEALLEPLVNVLKPHGLSHRCAGPPGLPCGQIAERMLTRDPDMTRLLDRLEARGLVNRCRDRADRRVVLTRITEQGMAVLAELDRPV